MTKQTFVTFYHRMRKRIGLACTGTVHVATSPSGKVRILMCDCTAWEIDAAGKELIGSGTKTLVPQLHSFIDDLRLLGYTVEANELTGIIDQLEK